jgi:hypothetical protein
MKNKMVFFAIRNAIQLLLALAQCVGKTVKHRFLLNAVLLVQLTVAIVLIH